jgi:transcriptional regulator with XRE-family HTH domain
MNGAALEVIAANVRAARAAAGLSLDALAARAQVSKGALIAVEAARGNPNLATLIALADALGLSMSALVEDRRAEDAVVVVDAAGVAPLWTGPDGGTARLLLTNRSPAPVEVWRWTLHPGERHGEQPHVAGITETITVVRGALRLDVGAETRTLRAGQTAVFAADVEHAYEGAGRGPCELLMTVHLPPDHRG